MNDDKPGDDFKTLGRGILRTFIGDASATILGAVIGGFVGFWLGFSIPSGAMTGAIIGLIARSLFKPLFDYGKAPKDKDKDT